MRNCIAIVLWLTLAYAGTCRGEEYMLTIQEVDTTDVEGLQPGPPGMPGPMSPAFGGWSEAGKAVLAQMNTIKSTEMLVSANARFHLRIEDADGMMELDGRLKKSEETAAKQSPATAPSAKKSAAKPGPELMVDIEYKYAGHENRRDTMKATLPMRCGKKYIMPGGSAVTTTTLWSITKVDAEAGK
jgi:hypothetical protein